jgi:Protein of unknown function (DUF3060)
MDPGDDPEKRIAELERQLAERRRIAELERQLADAKAAAGMGPPPAFSGSAEFGGQAGFPGPRARRKLAGANLFGAIAGVIGLCVGGAAALTAALPATALWTSAIVCGGPNQLMVNTSHYSYKPGQSGTSVNFQCLAGDGAHDANFFAISALQTLVVALVLGGAVAVGVLVRRLSRKQPLRPANVIIAGGLGLVAVAVVVAVSSQALTSSSVPTQMPQGGNLTIHGNGETKTIACNGGHLTVDGRDETVTVTGQCGRISVDGVINHVTVDSVDAIDVDGVNNVVAYHSGSPQINKTGLQNTVQQG